MSFIKKAKIQFTNSSSLADIVKGSCMEDVILYNPRTAFIKHDISKNLIQAENSLDIVAELEQRDPDEWVLFRARAIDAGGSEKTGEHYHGANDNGDYFSEEELLKVFAKDSNGRQVRSFETFINCPVFTNHQNTDIEKARGKIINAFYDKDNHCVYIDGLVDAKAYPELARGIREGYISDVSMGASVKSSSCSICGHEAENEKTYCTHIKNNKGKKIGGKPVYEINHGIKFIELSAVTDGACDNCTIQSAYSGSEFLKKLDETVRKGNSFLSSIKNASSDSTIKVARGEDVDKLNKALDLLKEVAEQILGSKDVDFEFLEDIGSLLAELQNLIVDLVEAGFANQSQGGGVPTNPMGEGVQKGLNTETQTETPPAPAEIPPTTSPPQPSPVGLEAQLPLAVSSPVEKNIKNSNKIKGLKTINQELVKLQESINRFKMELKSGENVMASSKELKRIQTTNKISEKFDKLLETQASMNLPIIISEGPYSVKIDFEKGITGYVGKEVVASISNEELEEKALENIKENPSVLAGRLIEKMAKKYNQNGEIKMAGEKLDIKEALQTNAPPQEQVQEGQLEDLSGNWSRKNDVSEATGQLGVTTQKQLDNVPKSSETGKGDWNRVRPEGVKENLQVTEGQLDNPTNPSKLNSERKESGVAKAEGQHSQVQEGQLGDKSLNFGSERWQDDTAAGDFIPVTENQFEGKDRQGTAINEVPEGQLKNYRQGPDVANSKSASIPARVVNAMINGMADAVLKEHVSPKVVAATKVGINDLLVDTNNRLAPYIKASIGSNMKLASPYLEDAISVLYEDKDYLQKKIASYVDAKIENLKKLASGVGQKTRFEVLREAFRKESERSAFSIDASVLSNLFPGVSDFTNLDEKMIKQKFLESNPGSKLLGFRKVDGGFIAELETDKNKPSEVQNNVSEQVPNLDSNSQDVSIGVGQETMNTNEEIPVSAEAIKKLKALAMQKKAQNPAGTTLPPAGGAPAGGAGALPPDIGGGAGSFAGPGAGADTEMAPDDELSGEETEVSGESKPFGAINPFTGNENVDVIDGHYRDADTGLEWEAEVNIKVLNPEKVKGLDFVEDEGGVDEGEGEPDTEGINSEIASPEAEPAAMPGAGGGGMSPTSPMASAPNWVKDAPLRLSMSLSPNMFMGSYLKTASSKTNMNHHKLGQVCPQCGSKDKVAFKNSEGNCGSCGCKTYVSTKKAKNGKVDSHVYMLPNIERSNKKNPWGGHAVTAEVENREEIQKNIHTILSQRKALLKAAATIDQDPWIACVSDQVTSGYSGDNAIQICSSIRDIQLKKIAMESENSKNPFEKKDKKKNEKSEDSNDEETDKLEDSNKSDDVDFEETEDKSKDDDVDFENESSESEVDGEELGLEDESSEIEGEEDNVEFENETEGEEVADSFGDEFEEIEEDDMNAEVAELGSPTSIKVTLQDAEGKTVELVADDGGITVSEQEEVEGEVGTEPEFGDDFGDGFGEEGDLEDDIEINDVVTDSDVEEDPLSSVFSDGLDKFDEEDSEDEEEPKMTSADIMAKSLQTSELLRGDRVASSNRSGGGSLDMDILAAALGFKKESTQTVPTGTPVKGVLRDESVGVSDEGGNVHTTEHENTAKKRNSIADSSFNEKGVVDGSGRGVEVIKGREGRFSGSNKDVVVANEKTSDCKKRKDVHPVDETGGGERTSKEKQMAKQFKGSTEPKEKKEASKNVKAQSQAKQTEPTDVGDGEKGGEKIKTPRNTSKSKPEEIEGRKDVKSPLKVRKDNYGKGSEGKNLHTDIVPRDKGGDGLGGKAVTFEKENSESATSGNPDTYVQKFQSDSYIKPTSYGKEENHATSGPNTASSLAIKKVASENGIKNLKNLEAVDFGGFIVVRDLKNGNTFRVE